jgi:hypothetical protein
MSQCEVAGGRDKGDGADEAYVADSVMTLELCGAS